MKSRKMVLMNLLAEKQWRKHKEIYGQGQEKRRRRQDEWGEQHGGTYTNICKTDSQREFTA